MLDDVGRFQCILSRQQSSQPHSYFAGDGFTTGMFYLNFVGRQFGIFWLRLARNTYTSTANCAHQLLKEHAVHLSFMSDNESLSNAVAGFMWKSNSYVNLIKAVDGLMGRMGHSQCLISRVVYVHVVHGENGVLSIWLL
jgi:hypothetical protein